jgi:hypothetical protein
MPQTYREQKGVSFVRSRHEDWHTRAPQMIINIGMYRLGLLFERMMLDGISPSRYAMKKMLISIEYPVYQSAAILISFSVARLTIAVEVQLLVHA